MDAPRYAVVSYLGGEIAAFAERIRRQLAPGQAHLRAHVTSLRPRVLVRSETQNADSLEAAAIVIVEQAARQLGPIRISLGDVAYFLPNHPTVYLPVEDGARHLRYLNGLLTVGVLVAADDWPYVPHLTLATLANSAETSRAREAATQEWKKSSGERQALLSELVLVREEGPERWTDVHTVVLGK